MKKLRCSQAFSIVSLWDLLGAIATKVLEPDKLQTKCLFAVWFGGTDEMYVCFTIEFARAGLRGLCRMYAAASSVL